MPMASANFWQSEWVWLDTDQPVVRFKGRHGIVKAKGAVEVQARGLVGIQLDWINLDFRHLEGK